MKFSIFSVVDHYPAELTRSVDRFYQELLEQAVAAEELGFHGFWIAEHHFHEYGAIPRPSIWMASAAERTKTLRLGSAVTLLPLDHPLRVAEDYAMVDVLSGGRLDLGVGSGYLKHEFDGFDMTLADKRERFDESLEILTRALSGERFSYEGTYWNIKDVALNVLPVQKPAPPMWIAVLRNEAAPFVGKRGLPIMMIPYASTENFEELANTLSSFRTAYEGATGKSEVDLPFGMHTCIADDAKTAEAKGREAMDRYVRTRLYAKQRSFETLVEKDLIAFGSSEDMVRIAKRYKTAGFNHFMTLANFGGMSHEKTLDTMERMAKEVIPHFQD